MTKLNPISFKVTKTLLNIQVKSLFNSEEVIILGQDSENDNELYVALNPNSTQVRTSTLSPTVTGIIGNNYTASDSGIISEDDIDYIFYTLDDITGVIVGETVNISQGIAIYTTTVNRIDGSDVLLNPIVGEPTFDPDANDILLFTHATWYYVTSNIDKVAIGDKFKITLEDDASIQIKEVTFKDANHIGFLISTVNYAQSDVISFECDPKLDGFAIQIKSNDFPNGLLFQHLTTDSTVNNLSILPKSEYNRAIKFFF